MKSSSTEYALYCDDVVVRFSLVTHAKRWELLMQRDSGESHAALAGVSLQVPRGKIVGVIGRNGAGKSTLLRTLAGVYPPTSGKVVRHGSVGALFELGGMGGVVVTGRQYVLRWLRLHGVPRRQWADLIDEIREFSELGDRLDDRILTYSAGMAARLYFATATSLVSDIYLIDEVLSVGDEHFQAKCWGRVRDRMSRGVSGVLVTHDWAAILRLCEYTYELEEGRIVASGNSEKVICDYLQLANQFDPQAIARFATVMPTTCRAVSGKSWVFDVPIQQTAPGPVLFNYSIEKLVLGLDWQILFMGIEAEVVGPVGCHTVRISVQSMPLPAGNYRLNLFLSGPRPPDGGARPVYDIRSWTTGNSLNLTVDGAESPGLVVMECVVESS